MEPPPERPPRVLLVEDDDSLRKVLRRVIRMDGRLEVIAEGRNGEEAVRLAAETKPDIILLDVRMPGMDGLEALPLVRDASPASAVVMLSMIQDPVKIDRALQAGAVGFVDKTTEPTILIDQLLLLAAQAAEPAARRDKFVTI